MKIQSMMYPTYFQLIREIPNTVKVLAAWVLLASCTKNEIKVIIECLPNDTLKFEYNLDKRLAIPDSLDGCVRQTLMPFPAYYGFTRSYASDDGDYLDAFVLTEKPAQRNTIVTAQISKVILMTDNGVEDSKLICASDGYNLRKEDITRITSFLLEYSNDSIRIDSIIDVSNINELIQLIDEYK